MNHPDYVQNLIHNAYTDIAFEQLVDRVRDLAIYLQRVAANTGNEQTARLVGDLIDDLTPPGDLEPSDAFG
jgi:hypothetical protein